MVVNITLLLKEGMQSKEIGDTGRVHGAVLRELHWQDLVVARIQLSCPYRVINCFRYMYSSRAHV